MQYPQTKTKEARAHSRDPTTQKEAPDTEPRPTKTKTPHARPTDKESRNDAIAATTFGFNSVSVEQLLSVWFG